MVAATEQSTVRHAIRWTSALLCAATAAASHHEALGEVVFDASPAVACRDVTPEEFEAAHPHEKIMEARVQISALVYRGKEDELREVFYQFTSPEHSVQIVDYLPKTTMSSEYVGNIAVEASGEQRNELSIGASGQFNSIVQANASGVQGSIDRSKVCYEMLPPQELVAASGTMHRGTGAYFKLRQSAQISLEGSREFVLLIRVPRGWRGDYLRLVCEARGAASTKTAAFLVPLYTQGDLAAQALADALGEAERQFLRIARENQREVVRRSQPTLAHELSLVEPRIPADWLAQLAHRPLVRKTPLEFERHLPPEVQRAAAEYRHAKHQLHALHDAAVNTDNTTQSLAADTAKAGGL